MPFDPSAVPSPGGSEDAGSAAAGELVPDAPGSRDLAPVGGGGSSGKGEVIDAEFSTVPDESKAEAPPSAGAAAEKSERERTKIPRPTGFGPEGELQEGVMHGGVQIKFDHPLD
jgi:hypothetical protein